jgi:hypothetical protein
MNLLLKWNRRRRRRREQVLADARQCQEEERRAALRRIRALATAELPVVCRSPLLTPGQAARSRIDPESV